MRSETRYVLITLSLLWLGGEDLDGQVIEAARIDRRGEFQSPHLTECSGIAVSRLHEGVLWAHNDSGHEPVLYATNLEGEDLGAVRVNGAGAVDWEDISAGPCPGSNAPCLYIADTGDNLERRPEVAIYIVPEPASLPGKGALDSVGPARAVAVIYPDGPHDVEAIAVTETGEISLFSKGGHGPILHYRVGPIGARSGDRIPASVDTLAVPSPRTPLEWVTGAATSPDGSRIAIRTYTRIVFLNVERPDAIRAAGPPCEIGFRESQGEAIDFLNDSTVVLGSEDVRGRKGGLWTAVCPHETRQR